MESPAHDFGRADAIDAEAIGQPGQRRFRLLVRSGGRNAAIWMEKEQLAAIGEWLAELLDRLDREHPPAIAAEEPPPFGAIFELDFRAAQIGLGYNEGDDTVALQTFDVGTQGPRTTFQCTIGRGQGRALHSKIEAVVSAGRPICPLCGTPIEPEGHVCARSNGHNLSDPV